MSEYRGIEVSCMHIGTIFKQAEQDGLDLKNLIGSVDKPIEHFENPMNRISWGDLAEIMGNLPNLGYSEEQIISMGRSMVSSTTFEVLGFHALTRPSLEDFYHIIHNPSEDGFVRRALTCVVPYCGWEDGVFTISISVEDGYDEIPELYLTTLGIIENTPTIYGAKPVVVTTEKLSRGMKYTFDLKATEKEIQQNHEFTGPSKLKESPSLQRRMASTLNDYERMLIEKQRESVELKQEIEELQLEKSKVEQLDERLKELESLIAEKR